MKPLPPLATLPIYCPDQTGWAWTGNVESVPHEPENAGPDLPSISIVTPSFNQKNYLEETIRSVVSQGYPNLEYLVLDGGSTDGSVDIIRKYEPWLTHWQSQPDGGQYDAIQKGFDLSHGEIMAYLNSDDLYFPWTLKVVGELFALFPRIDWLTTSMWSAANAESRFLVTDKIRNRSRRWFFSNRGRISGYICQESTFWRRSLWEKAGARLEASLRYAGDFELWARFYEHSSPVLVEMPLGIFRYQPEQKTSQLAAYIREANDVLNRYPKPAWMPSRVIRLLNRVYKMSGSEGNWFDARCDKVTFLPWRNRWEYVRGLGWSFV